MRILLRCSSACWNNAQVCCVLMKSHIYMRKDISICSHTCIFSLLLNFPVVLVLSLITMILLRQSRPGTASNEYGLLEESK